MLVAARTNAANSGVGESPAAVCSGVTKRVLILGLGFGSWISGCVRDNPAFDRESGVELADDTDPGESGEAPGDGDGESSTDDPTDPTDGDCTPGTSCGPCQVCDEAGACVIDVGAVCDGAALHCADYLYGPVESTCYRLTDISLASRCSEQGVCKPPPASECPLEQGMSHFACDPACVTNLDGCTRYASANEIEMSAMCSVNGEATPMCHPVCTGGNLATVQRHGCDTGECAPIGGPTACEPYLCNEQDTGCFEACETDAQCADPYTCSVPACG